MVTAKAVEARDGVVPDFSLPLINCLGTNLASRGNELISSALLRLSAGKNENAFTIMVHLLFRHSLRYNSKHYRKIVKMWVVLS